MRYQSFSEIQHQNDGLIGYKSALDSNKYSYLSSKPSEIWLFMPKSFHPVFVVAASPLNSNHNYFRICVCGFVFVLMLQSLTFYRIRTLCTVNLKRELTKCGSTSRRIFFWMKSNATSAHLTFVSCSCSCSSNLIRLRPSHISI